MGRYFEIVKKILFLLKLSPIHWWLLIEFFHPKFQNNFRIIIIILVKWWFSNRMIPSTFIGCYSATRKSFSFSPIYLPIHLCMYLFISVWTQIIYSKIVYYDRSTSQYHRSLWRSGYSDGCFGFSNHYGNHAHLTFCYWVLPLGPCHLLNQLFQLHLVFPVQEQQLSL